MPFISPASRLNLASLKGSFLMRASCLAGVLWTCLYSPGTSSSPFLPVSPAISRHMICTGSGTGPPHMPLWTGRSSDCTLRSIVQMPRSW